VTRSSAESHLKLLHNFGFVPPKFKGWTISFPFIGKTIWPYPEKQNDQRYAPTLLFHDVAWQLAMRNGAAARIQFCNDLIGRKIEGYTTKPMDITQIWASRIVLALILSSIAQVASQGQMTFSRLTLSRQSRSSR
jgi:hypothetical protein